MRRFPGSTHRPIWQLLWLLQLPKMQIHNEINQTPPILPNTPHPDHPMATEWASLTGCGKAAAPHDVQIVCPFRRRPFCFAHTPPFREFAQQTKRNRPVCPTNSPPIPQARRRRAKWNLPVYHTSTHFIGQQ